MGCSPTKDMVSDVFNDFPFFNTMYIIFVVFAGIATITTWIFYTRVGIGGILLNTIYTIGFISGIFGIALNSYGGIALFLACLAIDVFGAISLIILLFTDKVPQDMKDKLPFTIGINKIIFPSFATSQTFIITILGIMMHEMNKKCQ
mmetsp:Transcript_37663/g.46634  ORF Transcript_37663/g.46634 Transcript_37663/m.46634 type:complete len:147 (-) Transcript_37663:23-463(-)